jgi:alkyl hydroperoxide reductase subunit F
VTLVEFADQLKADAVLVNKLKSLPNVTIHVNAQTTEITGDGEKVNGLRYKDRATGNAPLCRWKACLCRLAWCPTPSG